tara:strand:+ start:696 stop:944 length:249 start_codon:yes stop_codon:yes gene_type:complete
MPNYKLLLDLSDLQGDLIKYDLREYRLPFSLYFIESNNPDEACSDMMHRIMKELIDLEDSIETRIICRKIRKYMRIDKIICL